MYCYLRHSTEYSLLRLGLRERAPLSCRSTGRPTSLRPTTALCRGRIRRHRRLGAPPSRSAIGEYENIPPETWRGSGPPQRRHTETTHGGGPPQRPKPEPPRARSGRPPRCPPPPPHGGAAGRGAHRPRGVDRGLSACERPSASIVSAGTSRAPPADAWSAPGRPQQPSSRERASQTWLRAGLVPGTGEARHAALAGNGQAGPGFGRVRSPPSDGGTPPRPRLLPEYHAPTEAVLVTALAAG